MTLTQKTTTPHRVKCMSERGLHLMQLKINISNVLIEDSHDRTHVML